MKHPSLLEHDEMSATIIGTTLPVVLLSDSTGDLGEHFIRALMTQFHDSAIGLKIYSFLTNRASLEEALREIESLQPVIFHTTIYPEFKKRIRNFAHERGLPQYDLTGGATRFLARATGLLPRMDPGALHELNQEYDERIQALEFTVRHDDGLCSDSLLQADIVLLGVSRTSKTPSSIYLANKGYKVANMPIILEVPLPEVVLRGIHKRVVGLTIDADKLRQMRIRRAEQEKVPHSLYTNIDHIRKELEFAQSLFLELGCLTIDITHHAIEETASLILKGLQLR